MAPASCILLLLLASLSASASDEWKDREHMNIRAKVHDAYMQEYGKKNKRALEPAPGWLRGMGAKLAAKSEIGLVRSWRFYVAGKREPDIVATPYGTVIVHRGMLDLGLEKDEVAALVAHQMAHVAEDHGVKVLFTKMSAQKLGWFAEEGTKDKGGHIARIKDMVLDTRYTLKMELDADKLAMTMLYRAGYDPGALISALKRFSKLRPPKKRSPGGYFAEHPGLWVRLGPAQKYLKGLEDGSAELAMPTATGRPEIGRPTYMRRAMDDGYDYAHPMKGR